jgi:phosphoglycolate phosphatase
LAPYFDALVGGDSTASLKPAALPLQHACELLATDVSHAAMVGDSAVDVAAAQAAGMPVYIVRYGYPGAGGLGALACNGPIDSFEQLPSLLAASAGVFPFAERPAACASTD